MEHVIVVPTLDAGDGRAVLRCLEGLAAADTIELRGAAVVERNQHGRWHFPEEAVNISPRGAVTGGALGALLGLLGGPAGLLLGGAAGLLAGAAVEAKDSENAETIVHALPRLVPPGATAVIADIYETGPEALDAALAALGSTNHWRMTRSDAEAQLEAARRRVEETGGASGVQPG